MNTSSPIDIPRPLVLVSRCLLGERCRWDGEAMANETVERLRERVDFLPVCPEREMLGLPCPRDPIRVVHPQRARRPRLIQPATRRDLTRDAFHAFNAWLETRTAEDGPTPRRLPIPDGLLLKAKSPSCGIRDVKRYPAPDAVAPIGATQGFFARWAATRWSGCPRIDERGLAEEVAFRRWWRRIHRRAGRREVGKAWRHGDAPPLPWSL